MSQMMIVVCISVFVGIILDTVAVFLKNVPAAFSGFQL